MSAPRLLIVPLSAVLLTACVIAPYPRRVVYSEPVPAHGGQQGYQQGYPGESGVVVDVAPPAAYVEVMPAIPFAGAIWLNGFWGWHGGRHHWNPGRWDRGRPGYHYRPHAWVQRGGRWHQQGGSWGRH